MSDETTLLEKMRNITLSFINALHQLNTDVKQVKHEVLEKDIVRYLDEPYSTFVSMYKSDSIEELMEDFNEFLEKINNKMIKIEKINSCDHEWMNDYIDITPELSQRICYCSKCELTK
jgi:thiaminase